MRADNHIHILLKKYGLKTKDIQIPEVLPLSFKFDLIEMFLKQAYDTGSGNIVYGSRNFRSSYVLLYKLYCDTQEPCNKSYLEFIKYSLRTAERIIKAYNQAEDI